MSTAGRARATPELCPGAAARPAEGGSSEGVAPARLSETYAAAARAVMTARVVVRSGDFMGSSLREGPACVGASRAREVVLDDADAGALDAVLGHALDVPDRAEGLHVAGHVGGATRQDVLAAGGLPGEPPRGPGELGDRGLQDRRLPSTAVV